MVAHGLARTLLNDGAEFIAHVEQKACVGLLQVNDACMRIRNLHVINAGEVAALGSRDGTVVHAVDGPRDVGGVEQFSIVEMRTPSRICSRRVSWVLPLPCGGDVQAAGCSARPCARPNRRSTRRCVPTARQSQCVMSRFVGELSMSITTAYCESGRSRDMRKACK